MTATIITLMNLIVTWVCLTSICTQHRICVCSSSYLNLTCVMRFDYVQVFLSKHLSLNVMDWIFFLGSSCLVDRLSFVLYVVSAMVNDYLI